MLKIISWWVRNSKAANLLMVSIILIGVLTFLRIEKEVFPIINSAYSFSSIFLAGSLPEGNRRSSDRSGRRVSF